MGRGKRKKDGGNTHKYFQLCTGTLYTEPKHSGSKIYKRAKQSCVHSEKVDLYVTILRKVDLYVTMVLEQGLGIFF